MYKYAKPSSLAFKTYMIFHKDAEEPEAMRLRLLLSRHRSLATVPPPFCSDGAAWLLSGHDVDDGHDVAHVDLAVAVDVGAAPGGKTAGHSGS